MPGWRLRTTGNAREHSVIGFSKGFRVSNWNNTKRTVEAHLDEPKLGELRECRDVLRDRAAELVAAEVESFEVRRERREQPQSLGERRPCTRDSLLNWLLLCRTAHTRTHPPTCSPAGGGSQGW